MAVVTFLTEQASRRLLGILLKKRLRYGKTYYENGTMSIW